MPLPRENKKCVEPFWPTLGEWLPTKFQCWLYCWSVVAWRDVHHPNHQKDVHHPNNQPPQKSQWGKVHLLLLARSLEVRKIRRGLTSALLSFAIWSTVCWKMREIFLLREKSVDRSWVDGWGGAPSLTIYRNVWNIHNRGILKFTLLQYKFKTTLKG